MKKVPAMSTRESSAVLGSPTLVTVTGSVLLCTTSVVFPAEAFPPVPFKGTPGPREQRFSGCSLKICPATEKVHINEFH